MTVNNDDSDEALCELTCIDLSLLHILPAQQCQECPTTLQLSCERYLIRARACVRVRVMRVEPVSSSTAKDLR